MKRTGHWGLRPGAAAAVILALLLAVTVWPTGARAESGAKTVRVGYYENEVFQEGAQEGAVKTGYAYEYYRKLSEYTGWKYDYVYGSFGELYQMLLDGEVDLLAGLAWREERSSLIGYPEAVMGHESYYLVKRDTDETITAEPETLAGRRIGVLDSAMVSVLEQYLADRHVSAEIVTFSDHPPLFEAFDSGAVDVLAVESDGAHGRDHAEVLSVFGASDYYLCVNKSRPDLLSELNSAQTLLAAEEPNYLNSLSAKYYSLSVTARAFSLSEREWMRTHSALRIGYLENYLPYSATATDGSVTGIVRDIIPEILKALGLQDISISYTGYASFDDMVADMGAGVIDAAFPVGGGLYYSEENGIYQSNAVVSSPTALIFSGEFNESKTASFAVNENNRMQYYYVQTNYPDAQIVFCPSIEACLDAVMSGTAGCTTLNGLRVNEILKNRQYEGLSIRQSSHNDDRCFGVEIGNEGLLKLLNRGINVLGSDYGQNVAYRYTEGLYTYRFVDMLADHSLLFGSVILAVAALIIFLLMRDSRRAKQEVLRKETARLELENKNRALAESQAALSDALVAAQQANRAKTAFLNNMSHDIRTPMNAIVGFTALAESHLDDREQVRDYLGKISVSGRHLLSLINDVLDMSRIESGRLTLEASAVHLPDFFEDLRSMIQPHAEAGQLQLLFDTREITHEDVLTDTLRLNQVLLNILSNAVKFTPAGGSVSFHASERPSAAPGSAVYVFRIRDTGIGMSEDFMKTIFEPFTRERTSTVSGIQGTGLGMAITKSIVDMMGGGISVSSAVGKGSEFVVELPLKLGAAPEAAPEAREAEQERPHEEAARKDIPEFAGKRVLLAEDNEMNQMIAEAILTEAGLSVDIACDGSEAVEKLKAAPAGTYAIILMDIQMPRMDGYEATREIRALSDREKAVIPIVAVTANAFEEDRRITQASGMNAHLAKPYDITAMIETIRALIGS